MKNIFITWHYTTHGVAYLKHILSKFYELEGLPNENIKLEKLNQEKLNTVFNTPNPNGFIFDKVLYLTTKSQTPFDKLSSRRFAYKNTILEDELVIEYNLEDVFKDIISNNKLCYSLEKEINHVETFFPDKLENFKSVIWRNIQHYEIDEQIYWLKEYSNFSNIYKDKFELIKLDIDDLRDEVQIATEVRKWAKTALYSTKEQEIIINISLGSNETQVIWHILAESKQLPQNTRFIKTYDHKDLDKYKRFKPFSIIETPTNLIRAIGDNFNIFNQTNSRSRQLVTLKIKVLLKTGFSILLIGERGIGKSQIAENESIKSSKRTQPFIAANCASFTSDEKAESELFGYAKGAFTGADPKGKDGLLKEANNGILFLDEIHHLSKLVQAKLMKALQTDEHNRMSIRKLGSNHEEKVELRLVFATNENINTLKVNLLPDFYDRIVQHVITIPPLRDTTEDRIEDWENVWRNLKIKGQPVAPKEDVLINWIKELPLYGNYRDLQKIAMYYSVYNTFDSEILELIPQKSAFEYAKHEFSTYHSSGNNDNEFFQLGLTTKQMIINFKYKLQEWAIASHGNSKKKAIEYYNKLGDTASEKTFTNWKNKEGKQ